MKKTNPKYVQKRNKPFEQSHCNINNRNSVLLINKKKKNEISGIELVFPIPLNFSTPTPFPPPTS